jgi:hypothetical protein
MSANIFGLAFPCALIYFSESFSGSAWQHSQEHFLRIGADRVKYCRIAKHRNASSLLICAAATERCVAYVLQLARSKIPGQPNIIIPHSSSKGYDSKCEDIGFCLMVLTFRNFPCKNVSKSKMGFFRNGYLSKINQGSRPSRVGSGQIIALLHCFCK